MNKRSFRGSGESAARYPTLRAFLQRHRLVIAGVGLCLLGSGATGCWKTMGEAPLPPAPADLRVERSHDGGLEASIPDDALAVDAEPDLRQQRPDRGGAR